MFADPQSVTINSVANPLPRVAVGNRTASYSKDDESVTLRISHAATSRGRTRRNVRLDVTKLAEDPFISGSSRLVSSSYQFTVDEPTDGAFSNADLLLNAKGLIGWLSDANVTKVLAGES